MKKVSDINSKVFDGKVNKSVLYHAIKMYQANKRQGSSATKTRAMVSGGGKKPWRQKGTGRARFGSSRNPIWRSGGVAFGPQPRDFSYTVNKKARLEALRSSINSKLNDKELVIVDSITCDSPKTKEFKKVIKSLKIAEKALFVFDKVDTNLRLASRNLKEAAIKTAADLNAMDVVNVGIVVVTKPALDILTKRIQG